MNSLADQGLRPKGAASCGGSYRRPSSPLLPQVADLSMCFTICWTRVPFGICVRSDLGPWVRDLSVDFGLLLHRRRFCLSPVVVSCTMLRRPGVWGFSLSRFELCFSPERRRLLLGGVGIRLGLTSPLPLASLGCAATGSGSVSDSGFLAHWTGDLFCVLAISPAPSVPLCLLSLWIFLPRLPLLAGGPLAPVGGFPRYFSIWAVLVSLVSVAALACGFVCLRVFYFAGLWPVCDCKLLTALACGRFVSDYLCYILLACGLLVCV